MKENITCPTCGAIINYYDGECLDINDYDTYVEKKVIGDCRNCHSTIVWYETYTFSKISEIYKVE